MKKKLLAAAIAGALAAPGASLAAIDDAGMKYISASEGLQGSIRIRLIDDTDGENRGVQTAYSSSRLIYVGDADLGGGMAATYLFEFRPEGGNGTSLNTENVDVGLRGPFGWIRAGRIESVSSAILPSADLTADVGSTGEKLAGDYDNGIRWTSPDINGLMLGLSAMMVDRKHPDDENVNIDDDSIDQFDIAAVYALPQGIKLGASYVKKAALPNAAAGYGDTDGFRLGVSYGQDNWSVAYNFHSYNGDNHEAMELGSGAVTDFYTDAPGSVAFTVSIDEDVILRDEDGNPTSTVNVVSDTDVFSDPDGQLVGNEHMFVAVNDDASIAEADAEAAGRLGDDAYRVFSLADHEDTEFTQHVVGARVQLGKIGLAMNYGTYNVQNDKYDTRPFAADGTADTDIQKLDHDSNFFAFDAAYSLGSKSRLIAAFKSVDRDEHPVTGEDTDEDSYYLLYRVDF